MGIYQQLYEAAVATPSDINEHLTELVHIVQKLEAKTVIELGVRYGASTAAFLHALEQTDGHLWSVDPVRLWNGVPLDRWTFLEGYDTDEHVLAALPEQADIIFIDTTHEYLQTRAEIELYRSRVREGGAMIFHDTNVEWFDHHIPQSQPPFPVRRAVNELLGDKPHTVFSHNNGLTEVWFIAKQLTQGFDPSTLVDAS